MNEQMPPAVTGPVEPTVMQHTPGPWVADKVTPRIGQAPTLGAGLEGAAPQSANWSASGGKLLLSEREVATAFGVSQRKIAELRAAGLLPPPLELGPRLLKWPRFEIEAAIANWPRRTAAAEPAQLLKSRVERAIREGVIA